MLRRRLDKFKEADFGLFRASFESGRQSPKSAAKWLWSNVFTQSFMFLMLFIVTYEYTRLYMFKQVIVSAVFLFTVMLIILSVIYSIPQVYKKKEHIQYKILSLGLFNNAIVHPFFIGIFMLMQANNTNDFIYIVLAVLLILLGVGLFTIIFRQTTVAITNGYFSRVSTKNDYDGL